MKKTIIFVWINFVTIDKKICEVACVLTDKELTHISTCFKISIKQEVQTTDVNLKSLLKEVLESPYSKEDTETALYQFIKDKLSGRGILVTNSEVNNLIKENFNSINSLFDSKIHLESLKQFYSIWFNRPRQTFSQDSRATPKILEMIDELRFYKDNLCLT